MAEFKDTVFKLVREGKDLTVRQLCLLLMCAEKPQTVRYLAQSLKVSKPAISRAADKLADIDYVVRKPDPDDRRSVLIELRPVGKRFVVDLTG